MSGPFVPHRSVHINVAIFCDLLWLVQRIHSSDGVFLLQSLAWHADEANLTLYTDASLTGFGFWSPQHPITFYGANLPTNTDAPIFFHEAIAVARAVHWACHHGIPLQCHLVIRTNSMNTVDVFNTLQVRNHYNEIG